MKFVLQVIQGAVVAVQCDATGLPLSSLPKVRDCLAAHVLTVTDNAGPIPSSLARGGIVVAVNDNAVQVVVDASDAHAEAVAAVFARSIPLRERAGLPDRLRRYNNVVTLWRDRPTPDDLRLVVSCFA